MTLQPDVLMRQPQSRWEQLKQEIKEAGPALGIDDIGFTTADPFFVSARDLRRE